VATDRIYSIGCRYSLPHSRDMRADVRSRKVSLTEVAAWAVVLIALGAALWELFRWLGTE